MSETKTVYVYLAIASQDYICEVCKRVIPVGERVWGEQRNAVNWENPMRFCVHCMPISKAWDFIEDEILPSDIEGENNGQS